MAIELSGTPQYQKAPFEAFDTSSNFRSGLVDVGQAIKSVGAGQQRIKERAERDAKIQAEKDRRDAEKAQAELAAKEKQEQELIALEIEAAYDAKLNQAEADFALALKIDDPDAIKAAQKEIDSFNPQSADYDLNNFSKGSAQLTDPNILRKTLVSVGKSYSNLATKLTVERVNSGNFKKIDEYLKRTDTTAADFINNNEAGVSNEVLTKELYDVIDDKFYIPIRNATSTGEPRAIFDKRIRQQMVDRMINQFDHTKPLTEDEVKSRYRTITELFNDPKFKEANVIFDVDDVNAVRDAYNDKLKEVTQTGYQQRVARTALNDVSSSLKLALDTDVITPSIIGKAMGPLKDVDVSVLSTSQEAKYYSQVALSRMFTEGDTPLAYLALQGMAMQPAVNKTELGTQLQKMLGDDYVNLGLEPSEQQMLSDWLNKNLSQLRDIGDNPEALALLSPYHKQVMDAARMGSDSARLEAKRMYEDFVKNQPDLKGVAPPKFYIGVGQFPDTTMGNQKTFTDAVITNVTKNGADSAYSHAMHRMDQGDVTGLELLRFESEKLASKVMIQTNNSEQAAEAVAVLVSNYTSGLEPDSVVDDLVDIITAEDNKHNRGDSGYVIPLINLSNLHKDLLTPSKSQYFDTILRGYVKLNKDELVDMDDAEDQHELIREKTFKDRDVFPFAAATEAGTLIELPSELGNYINLAKDRTGFFGRPFYPYGKIMSDTESASNVQALYSAAVIADMVNTYPSLNIDEQLRDIIKDLEGVVEPFTIGPFFTEDDVAETDETSLAESLEPVGDDYITEAYMGYQVPTKEMQRTIHRRAFLRGVLGNRPKGFNKPVARLSITAERDANGEMQEVATLMTLTRSGNYKELPRSKTDQRPITVPVSRAVAIVNKIMPEITGVSPTAEKPLRPLTEFLALNTTFWTQLLGMETSGMHTRSFREYDRLFVDPVLAAEEAGLNPDDFDDHRVD